MSERALGRLPCFNKLLDGIGGQPLRRLIVVPVGLRTLLREQKFLSLDLATLDVKLLLPAFLLVDELGITRFTAHASIDEAGSASGVVVRLRHPLYNRALRLDLLVLQVLDLCIGGVAGCFGDKRLGYGLLDPL